MEVFLAFLNQFQVRRHVIELGTCQNIHFFTEPRDFDIYGFTCDLLLGFSNKLLHESSKPTTIYYQLPYFASRN